MPRQPRGLAQRQPRRVKQQESFASEDEMTFCPPRDRGAGAIALGVVLNVRVAIIIKKNLILKRTGYCV